MIHSRARKLRRVKNRKAVNKPVGETPLREAGAYVPGPQVGRVRFSPDEGLEALRDAVEVYSIHSTHMGREPDRVVAAREELARLQACKQDRRAVVEKLSRMKGQLDWLFLHLNHLGSGRSRDGGWFLTLYDAGQRWVTSWRGETLGECIELARKEFEGFRKSNPIESEADAGDRQ